MDNNVSGILVFMCLHIKQFHLQINEIILIEFNFREMAESEHRWIFERALFGRLFVTRR